MAAPVAGAAAAGVKRVPCRVHATGQETGYNVLSTKQFVEVAVGSGVQPAVSAPPMRFSAMLDRWVGLVAEAHMWMGSRCHAKIRRYHAEFYFSSALEQLCLKPHHARFQAPNI